MFANETEAAESLLSATAVRERSHELLALGLNGELRHFTVQLDQLEAVIAYVLETIRQNYPSLDIPFHARWRHFAAGGKDRWGEFAAAYPWPDEAERSRAAFDLAIVSVLLDAGAGPAWRYRETDGVITTRSEGLAVASFDMFVRGSFSRTSQPRADGVILSAFSTDHLANGFQVSSDNPLVGVEGRVALLNALGQAVLANPLVFGQQQGLRPGGLFDHLAGKAESGRLPASAILAAVLQYLGPIWPSRLTLGGVPLGDCWRYPGLERSDATNGLVPFHKLSQWLSYSLIEPLQWAGIAVTDIDGLTGLPEYRNGGLLLDLGLIDLKDKSDVERPHEPSSALVVEWRALTVALLDKIGEGLRAQLGFDAESFPLAKALEGGTWAAGRRIAKEKRADGGPPLQIVSDGTVF